MEMETLAAGEPIRGVAHRIGKTVLRERRQRNLLSLDNFQRHSGKGYDKKRKPRHRTIVLTPTVEDRVTGPKKRLREDHDRVDDTDS